MPQHATCNDLHISQLVPRVCEIYANLMAAARKSIGIFYAPHHLLYVRSIGISHPPKTHTHTHICISIDSKFDNPVATLGETQRNQIKANAKAAAAPADTLLPGHKVRVVNVSVAQTVSQTVSVSVYLCVTAAHT